MPCLHLCSENYRLSRHDHLTCAKRSQYHRVLLPCNDLHHSNLKCVVLFQKVCIQYCLQFLLVAHPKLMDIPVPMGNQPLPPHYPRCAKVQLSIFLDTGIYAFVMLLMCCCCKEYTYSHPIPHFCNFHRDLQVCFVVFLLLYFHQAEEILN